MSKVIMQVKNITKKFPANNNRFLTACDDVSLNINAGETVGIVGESGCGKSTLVKTIMNMHAPTSGEVIFHNQDITKLTYATLPSLNEVKLEIEKIITK